MNINLHIERLVLDGVTVDHRYQNQLKNLVESSLRQQLVSNEINTTLYINNNYATISGGSISIDSLKHRKSFGKQIGNAVYKGIRKCI